MVTKEQIIHLIKTNDRAVERALLVLLDRQTEAEKFTRSTNTENGVGFTKADAGFFTSLAQQVKNGRTLSPRQIACCRKPNKKGQPALGKYWRQLLDAAEAKASSHIPVETAPAAELPVASRLRHTILNSHGHW